MDSTSAELSIVMPAYNEEVSIQGAIDDVVRSVVPCVASAEIIVVDDGSRDGTSATLAAYAAREPRLNVIRRPNGGHGPALITGLNAATGRSVLILDSDRQIELDDFAAFWRAYGTADAVLGIRALRQDDAVRRAISQGLRRLLGLLFGPVPRDTNVPFKIIARDAWAKAAPAIGPDNPIPSALLALHLGMSGARIVQLPVVHRPRIGSVSNFRGWKLFRFCLIAGAAVISFRLDPRVRATRATPR